MKATLIYGAGDVRVEEREDPVLVEPTAQAAEQVVAGPITLSVAGSSFDVPAAPLAEAVTFPVTDGSIAAAWDAKAVVAAVRAAGYDLD